MMGIHFMGEVPFRVVYLHAMVRDEKGEKMSKVKGNVVDPLDVIHGQPASELPPGLRNKFPQGMPAFGADALRYTLAALAAQGRDIKLSLDRVNGYKAFTNKLWNASRFLLLYLGDFHPGDRALGERTLTLADRWILSGTERVTREVNDALGRFEFAEAASALYQFTWHGFCDWYIELAKPALQGTDSERRDTTRAVLIHVLDRVLRLLHPFMPFITEEIWHRLPGVPADAFLMLAAYPQAGPEDAAAEAEMAPVIAVIDGIRNIRGESNLPPLQRIRAVVQTDDATLRAALERHRGYVEPLAGLSDLGMEVDMRQSTFGPASERNRRVGPHPDGRVARRSADARCDAGHRRHSTTQRRRRRICRLQSRDRSAPSRSPWSSPPVRARRRSTPPSRAGSPRCTRRSRHRRR
jgi:valyl-tRNA synthetase